MEILFHRYGSICEPDIIDAFTSLGITVLEEDSEIQNKHISGEGRIRLLAEKILTRSRRLFSALTISRISRKYAKN